ncbi:MAG TPA: 3-deoxy-manno-octulosonate cytidylyltransferase [Vicinamibacterales bacterium]|nr:3-deoxy-manno-octulosonate cytidylyltransferase [Vicinamibacterales bacterium]
MACGVHGTTAGAVRRAPASSVRAPVVRFAVPPVSSPGPLGTSPSFSATAVIPARYLSTRFPGKPLVDIAGRPMIEHVYRRASAARSVDRVIVATDDERIAAAVRAFGGDVRMTAATHRSGTDRLAEVAAALGCDLVVNVQGDEPLVEPAMIDEAVAPFTAAPDLQMSTLRRRLDDPAERANPNVTKVVVDRAGYALYFSRAPIPYVRNGCPPAPAYRHIGLYVYRRECLLQLARLAPTALEESEALEQLRALEHGIRIKVVETQHDAIGVDTPDDLDRVRRLLETRSPELPLGAG